MCGVGYGEFAGDVEGGAAGCSQCGVVAFEVSDFMDTIGGLLVARWPAEDGCDEALQRARQG